MKRCLACVVLCAAIVLISLGAQTYDFISIILGGLLVGAYDAMIHKQD